MNRLIYWTARLLAADPSALPYARELRTRLEHTSTQSPLAIIDALIAHSDGDNDLALSLLRDANDPDSRSSLLALLADTRSAQFAVDWSNEQNKHSDPKFLTAFGWTNWAICSAELELWEPAAKQLLAVEHLWDASPRLPFVEGAINAAFLLPEDYRNSVLQGVPLYPGIETAQGSLAQAHHARSTACFQAAAQTIHNAPDSDFAKLIAQWTLWLRLADPNVNNASSARSEIQQRMSIGSDAAELIVFAVTFEIPFESHPLQRHLYNCKQFGGLDDNDLIAEFMLARTSMSPRRLYSYVEQHHTRLSKVLSPAFLLDTQVDALMADGQTHRARTLIEANTPIVDAEHLARMNLAIDAKEGIDPRTHLEDLYRQTGRTVDLQNLASYLSSVGDATALRPLTLELFRRVQTVGNALNVVTCLTDPLLSDYPAVLCFLETNRDLVHHSPDLASANAWALFMAGRLDEAKQANDSLLSQRQSPVDFYLDTRISLASGSWERLGEAIDREWPRRRSHDQPTLLYMAWLASQASDDPSRALAIAHLATEPTSPDPRVLAGAYWLYCKLGHENRADPAWLRQASDLSSEERGPVWQLDSTYVINQLLPKRHDFLLEVERAWRLGKIPIGTAASVLNASLTRMLLHVPKHNARLTDGRTRYVLPIISGARTAVETQKSWTIGFDVTSIMILHYLGILNDAIRSFNHVKLASEIMEILFQERDDARYHQPSRIRAAKQIKELQRTDAIHIAPNLVRAPEQLTQQLGPELASLLHTAQQNDGFVVCALPVHKAASPLHERADTSTHDHLIWSTIDICEFLYEHGSLDSDQYRRAVSALSSRNQTPRTTSRNPAASSPIYVDYLALAYLQDVNALEPLATSGFNVLIHPDVSSRASELIAEDEVGSNLATQLETIRTILRSAIDDGRASFLPRTQNDQRDDERDSLGVATTLSLLGGASACNALCIDDRYFNRNPFVSVDQGNVPIICTLDLLRHLQRIGTIDQSAHWALRHRLRRSGFAFVLFDDDELWHWLSKARFDGDELIESAELKAIRQEISRVDSQRLMTDEEALTLSSQFHKVSRDTVERLWSDESAGVEHPASLSQWVWRTLVIQSAPFCDESEPSQQARWLNLTMALRTSQLLLPIAIRSEDQLHHLARWIDECVLNPLRPANAEAIHAALQLAHDAICAVTQHGEAYGNLFLQQLPSSARTLFLSRHPKLSQRCGFALEPTFGFGFPPRVPARDLTEAVKRVFVTNNPQTVQSVSGPEVAVLIDPSIDEIVVECADENGKVRRVRAPELGIHSPFLATRRRAIRHVVDRIGPTGPASIFPPGGLESRELTDDEIGVVFTEIADGVAATQLRLCEKLQHQRPVTIADLVPGDISYYERFCGPNPEGGEPDLYFREVLIPHRRELLARDLAKGLDVCLLGALRDDLSPGPWLSDVADDEVWSALESSAALDTPFSLLGAMDLALYRQRDPRFEGLARRALTSLCEGSFGGRQDLNIHLLLPHLVDVVLYRLNVVPNGATYPAYWKRTCAWMQAGFVANTLSRFGGTMDVDWLRRWTQSNLALGGVLGSLIDLRREPMFLSTRPTPQLLQNEVIGRLCVLRARHEGEGRRAAVWEVLDAHLATSPTRTMIPGPLEAHRRPTEAAPRDVVEELEAAWSQEEEVLVLQRIATASHSHGMPEAVLDRVRITVQRLSTRPLDQILSCLAAASMIAAISRDVKLADEVARVATNAVSRASERPEIHSIVQIIFRSAAAHEELDEWRTWLDGVLTTMAYSVPAIPTHCLKTLQEHFHALGTVLPMDSWVQQRALSIASCGEA